MGGIKTFLALTGLIDRGTNLVSGVCGIQEGEGHRYAGR